MDDRGCLFFYEELSANRNISVPAILGKMQKGYLEGKEFQRDPVLSERFHQLDLDSVGSTEQQRTITLIYLSGLYRGFGERARALSNFRQARIRLGF